MLGFFTSLLIAFGGIGFVSAQSTVAEFDRLGKVLSGVYGIVNAVIAIAVALAFLFFFWGIATFLLNLSKGKSDVAQEAKNKLLWGIIAIFVLSSIWGLVFFLRTLFLSAPGSTQIGTFRLPPGSESPPPGSPPPGTDTLFSSPPTTTHFGNPPSGNHYSEGSVFPGLTTAPTREQASLVCTSAEPPDWCYFLTGPSTGHGHATVLGSPTLTGNTGVGAHTHLSGNTLLNGHIHLIGEY